MVRWRYRNLAVAARGGLTRVKRRSFRRAEAASLIAINTDRGSYNAAHALDARRAA